MRHGIRTFLAAAALAASFSSAAQPGDLKATTEATAYGSAFEGYRPFQPGEIQDWRKSNDTVREIGGWRAYAREIQGAKSASAPTQGERAGDAQGAPVDPHKGHHQ